MIIKLIIFTLTFCLLASCEQLKKDKSTSISSKNIKNHQLLEVGQLQNPNDFIPKGYVLNDKIKGDLNNDGYDDCVLIIKGTEKNNMITDEYQGTLDRNRRGIIVLFNRNNYYELGIQNHNCFSSENEDGGVYFPPELSVEIKEQILSIQYGHGRYGYWSYKFHYDNLDFQLFSYVQSDNRGPIVERETSINFLSKKKQEKININKNIEAVEDEVFEITWKNIVVDRLIKLSEIKDFDQLEMSTY